jgi:hypothetical protein
MEAGHAPNSCSQASSVTGAPRSILWNQTGVPGAPFLPSFGRSGDFPDVDFTPQGTRPKFQLRRTAADSSLKVKSPTSRKNREKWGTRCQISGLAAHRWKGLKPAKSLSQKTITV